MADAVSAIIGVVSAAVSIAQQIHAYVSSAKNAPREARDFAAQVYATQAAMEMLKGHLSKQAIGTFDRTSVLLAAANGCRQKLEMILKKVGPLAIDSSRTLDRLLWPFHESDMRHATESLHHYVQIFTFVYNMDGLSIMAASQTDAAQQLNQKLERLTEKQDAAAPQIRSILQAFKSIRDSVEPIRNGVEQLERKLDQHTKDARLSRLLDYLPALSFGEKHRDIQQRRTEGLGQWLLHHEDFASWYDGTSQNCALWCMGAPGAGKTYLTSVVVDFLARLPNRGNGKPRVLYFYYDYKYQEKQTPSNVLSCLLRQLLSTHTSIPDVAANFAEDVTESGGYPSWESLTRTFLSVCSQEGPVFVVLDALDECDENKNRRSMLWLLQRLMSTAVRTFVTSRPHCPDINDMLTPCTQIEIEASESDIRAFLHAEIDYERRISKKVFEAALVEDIVLTILQKSCGIFLVPALQIDFVLSHTNEVTIRESLSRLPLGLKSNLDLSIDRMKSQDTRSDAMGQLALNALMWLSHVKRQLSIDELRHALASKKGMTQLSHEALETGDIIVKACLGLVTVDEETLMVRFVHQTVNEYLQERAASLFPGAHRMLTLSCLSYLMQPHFYTTPLSNIRDLKTLLQRHPFLNYSGRYWGHHASACFEGDVVTETNNLLSTTEQIEFCGTIESLCSDSNSRYDRDQGDLYDRGYLVRHSTPCHIASRFGITELAKAQLDNGFDVNWQDSKKQTSLMISASFGHTDIVKILLADPTVKLNLVDARGSTALVAAVQNGRTETVELLLSASGIDVNLGFPLKFASGDYFSMDGSPFEAGIAWNKSKIASLLLARPDTQINVFDSEKIPLWQVVAANLDYGTLNLLMARDDFDPSLTDAKSRRSIPDTCHYMLNSDVLTVEGLVNNTLILQAMERHPQIAMEDYSMLSFMRHIIYYAFSSVGERRSNDLGTTRVLGHDIWVVGEAHRERLRDALEQEGCNLSITDSQGRGFLHYAAAELDMEYAADFAEYLLEHGLDVDSRDKDGSTPLHVALSEGSERMAMIKLLQKHGADLLATTKFGETMLHMAAIGLTEYSPIFDTLLDAGIDVNATTRFKITALHLTTKKELVKFLLEHGANPNICSMRGLALHESLYDPELSVIKELVDSGSDLNILDCMGRSCFDYMTRYPPFAELLPSRAEDSSSLQSHTAVQHILENMKARISLFLRSFEDSDGLRSSLGRQLLVLGDDVEATVALSRHYTVQKADTECGEPKIKCKYRCWNCTTTEGYFHECRDCGLTRLCSKCVTEPAKKETPWCVDHSFLEVPSQKFVTFPVGVVNEEGQTLKKWLEELDLKYSSINNEEDLAALRARGFKKQPPAEEIGIFMRAFKPFLEWSKFPRQ